MVEPLTMLSIRSHCDPGTAASELSLTGATETPYPPAHAVMFSVMYDATRYVASHSSRLSHEAVDQAGSRDDGGGGKCEPAVTQEPPLVSNPMLVSSK